LRCADPVSATSDAAKTADTNAHTPTSTRRNDAAKMLHVTLGGRRRDTEIMSVTLATAREKNL